jgi:Predicted DNA alkylation repair enzyme
MELESVILDLLNNRDEHKAVFMRAYMRNKFHFLGIHTSRRKEICRPYFKHAKKSQYIDWKFVYICWINKYREMQYVAKDYLIVMKDFLTTLDIHKIKELAIIKSWWDTIDGLDRIIGDVILLNPDQNDLMIQWSTDDNIWLRRIAIDHQLSRKNKTNTELLEKIIVNNFGSDEFFINKAIGWSLREYSKTNPQWVRSFIESNSEKMAKLSIKEASKYI